MNNGTIVIIVSCLASTIASFARAQDWPQWRGPNRDAKAVGFKAPETWPAELTHKWKRSVGDGVATPALVGDKLYVFTRQEDNEVLRCLDAATGEELWNDMFAAQAVEGAAARFGGPRSSPVVADGNVVTLGVKGTLSCLVAATGELVWRNNEYQDSVPRFATSSSPLVIDGLCIAQLGGNDDGVIYGISNLNTLFCVNEETGQTAWNSPIGAVAEQPETDRARGQGSQGGQRRGCRRGGGRGGYGSVVDVGSVLFALTPEAKLTVFQPSGESYAKLAEYTVADHPTHAYPVASGNRIFVKDSESVTLWIVD